MCVSKSPRQCLVLTFAKLTIQPKVLLHIFRLDKTVSFSINTMATKEGAARIRDELLKRQGKLLPEARIVIMDLRDSLAE